MSSRSKDRQIAVKPERAQSPPPARGSRLPWVALAIALAACASAALGYVLTRSEVLSLRSDVAALRGELQEVKRSAPRSAAQRPSPVGSTLTTAGAFAIGSPQAKLTLIEYSDYQ